MNFKGAAAFADSELAPRVADFYRTASPSVRVRLLSALLEPLGTLALVAVAAGAFARFLPAHLGHPRQLSVDMVEPITAEQIEELARYVEQKSPEVLVKTCKDELPVDRDHPRLTRGSGQAAVNH